MNNNLVYSSLNNTTDISVIIVNYKSWVHLENCLKSIEVINQDSFSFEVIVIDNNSNDNKLDSFSKNFPQFKFIRNSGNNGFSNGNNFGTHHANGEFFLFLNPDTIISKPTIETILELVKKNLDFAIVSCSQLNKQGKAEKEIRLFPKLYSLFGLFRALNKWINRKNIDKKYNDTMNIVFPDWVSGSLILISKKWYNRINGWNEDYWLYFEDVDLCKRVSDAGGKIALARNANIIHNHGCTSRINIKTAALTKAEVIISKHVYINSHFNSINKILAHFLVLFFGLITKFLLGCIGIIFFFIPKLFIQSLLFINLIKYYINAFLKQTWISKRSPNYSR